jgi:hypothetical protein
METSAAGDFLITSSFTELLTSLPLTEDTIMATEYKTVVTGYNGRRSR